MKTDSSCLDYVGAGHFAQGSALYAGLTADPGAAMSGCIPAT